MKNITVKYGIDSMTKSVDVNFTISDLKNDENIQCGLGFGDNINCLINGVAQGDCVVIPDGAIVSVETAANQKAS